MQALQALQALQHLQALQADDTASETTKILNENLYRDAIEQKLLEER